MQLSYAELLEEAILLTGPYKTVINECMTAWLQYFQVLDNLCDAGSKVSQSLIVLSKEANIQFGAPQPSCPPPPPSLQTGTQSLSGWEQLTNATIIATNTVKAHIVRELHKFIVASIQIDNFNELQDQLDLQKFKETCHQVLCDCVLSLVNLQYQFCIACSECLGNITTCPCCQATAGQHEPECSMTMLQQCFSRLYASHCKEASSQTTSPYSGLLPSHHNPVSLESPKTNVDTVKNLLQEPPSTIRSNVVYHDRNHDGHRYFHNQTAGTYDRNQQHIQSSGSSSDSPKSPYIHTDSLRNQHQNTDIYRGPSPTLLHQDYLRLGTEGVKCLEPRGPSPFSGYHEPIRGPSPVQNCYDNVRGPGQMDTIRGPFPNPGILLSMKSPFLKSVRSPLHFQLFPLNGQRRWSEAAAGEMGDGQNDDGTMRRWSMPWDAARGAVGQASAVPLTPYVQHNVQGFRRLKQPHLHYSHSSDRSRSTTPDWQCSVASGSITSQDGLVEAIQLLSCKPGVRPPYFYYHGPPAPSIGGLEEVWSEEGKECDEEDPKRYHVMPSRWPQARHSDVSQASDVGLEGVHINNVTHAGTSSDPSCQGHGSSSKTNGGNSSAGVCTGMGGLYNSTVIETIEPTDPIQGYSIWSGRDHLPFLRLPESQEYQNANSNQ